MAGTADFSFAFLESHPGDAARVMERLAPPAVSALLADAPVRLVAPALRVMMPLHVSRCLEVLADDTATGLLRAMGPQAGVAVLHYLPEARRNALLGQLPTALAVAFRLLLGYPGDTVGACMDPRVLALPADTSAEAVVRRLREADAENDSMIFVIGADQRLLGQVDLPEVLRVQPDTLLSKVMHKVAHALPARTGLRAVETHPGWNDFHILPVVERDDRFVGALDRGVLVRALLRDRNARPKSGYGDVAALVAGNYWLGVSGAIQVLVGLLPVAPPATDEEAHER